MLFDILLLILLTKQTGKEGEGTVSHADCRLLCCPVVG
jgi:hypothetical protein